MLARQSSLVERSLVEMKDLANEGLHIWLCHPFAVIIVIFDCRYFVDGSVAFRCFSEFHGAWSETDVFLWFDLDIGNAATRRYTDTLHVLAITVI